MSLTITNQPSSLPFQGQTNTNAQNVNAPADIKEKALERLANKESQIETRNEKVISNMNERLGVIQQRAEEGGYTHLGNAVNRVTDAVNNAGQRVAESVEHRFDVKEKLIEQRSVGSFEATEENTEALIGRLESKAEARIAALDERSNAVSDRLAELELRAMLTGHNGLQISDHADKVDEHFQQLTERVEESSEQVIERTQSMLKEAYENTPSADLSNDEPVVA